MGAVVRSAVLTNFAPVASELGLDPAALLREFGFEFRVLSDPDYRLSSERIAALLEVAAERSRCSSFGLRMAERRSITSLGPVSLLLAHEATLRDVLEVLSGYRSLLNEAHTLHIFEQRDQVVLEQELAIDPPGSAVQASELGLGMLTCVARHFLGARWRPLEVCLAHAAPADLSVHHRSFGRGLHFDSDGYRIVFSRADFDRSNPRADSVLAGYARGFINMLPLARRETEATEVRKAVYQLLARGDISITRVAPHLGLTARTLQRRLLREGTSYSELVEDVRRTVAMRLLANPSVSMTTIAAKLGYAQSSAFTRWFVTEFGCSPSRYRACGIPPGDRR